MSWRAVELHYSLDILGNCTAEHYLPSIISQYIALHRIALTYIPPCIHARLHHTKLGCVALRDVLLRSSTVHCIAYMHKLYTLHTLRERTLAYMHAYLEIRIHT